MTRPRPLAAAVILALLSAGAGCPGAWGPGDNDSASDATVTDGLRFTDGTGALTTDTSTDDAATAGDGRPAATDSVAPWPDAGLQRCSFAMPKDGAEIADDQTYAEILTENIATGAVAAMLVDFVPQASAQVSGGKAEFPSIALPPPSDKAVELRAEVRVSFAHKISCAIHVTVKDKAP